MTSNMGIVQLMESGGPGEVGECVTWRMTGDRRGKGCAINQHQRMVGMSAWDMGRTTESAMDKLLVSLLVPKLETSRVIKTWQNMDL